MTQVILELILNIL
jgi:hypothetical protein